MLQRAFFSVIHHKETTLSLYSLQAIIYESRSGSHLTQQNTVSQNIASVRQILKDSIHRKKVNQRLE